MKHTTLQDNLGAPVTIGAQLGRGGEGAVFEVRGNPQLVAKIYHQPPASDKAQKLSAMVQTHTPQLGQLAAWPMRTLHAGRGAAPVGFLMPRISQGFDLHKVYAPRDRLRALPDKNYRFLIRVAANIARAFHCVHAHGHVIGDVNQGNVVVAPDATVRLIDCDSFQVKHGGRVFTCDVGVLHYQPPELQTVKTFRGVQRSPNFDYFGMSVQIFQLLFLARHPFAGRFSGQGDMPIERAILENRFAYGASSRQAGMTPPPGALTLQFMPPAVAQLFERAFSPASRNGGRPTPAEWVQALSAFEQNTVACRANGNHLYFSSLPSCPICAIERGTILFLPPISRIGPAFGSTFNLAAVWAAIERVQIPQVGAPPSPQQIRLKAQGAIQDARQSRLIRRFFAIVLPVLALIIVGNVSNRDMGGGAKTLFVIATFAAAFFLWKWQNLKLKKEVTDRLNAAKRQYEQQLGLWRELESSNKVRAILSELSDARQHHQHLPQERLAALDNLKRNHRHHQLMTYLDKFEIANARLKGIGASKATTLESYQIETAADITYEAVIDVPGFGPKTAEKLVAWRRALEARFRYDPTKPIDPAAINATERQIVTERARLEQVLSQGAQRLQLEAATLNARVTTLRPMLEKLVRDVAQAEADAKAI